ncbi:unnamed protein product [Schistosoma curassoni]|uniref:Uncharacterized protein n=1 Tax=Schistosoma curassoni TaxID=6186 RepID=A0A183K7Y3_9TREM|nr:unnamed protein product [Schistosoma curassoni]
MLDKGVEAVIHLWNSWYLPSTGHSLQTSPFRLINPSSPEAVGLLRSRLTALSLYSVYELNGQSLPKSTITSNEMGTNEQETKLHNVYHQKRQFLSSEVNKTRGLFDLLSTSQWGSHCPGLPSRYIFPRCGQLGSDSLCHTLSGIRDARAHD